MFRAQAGLGEFKPQGLGFVRRRPAPGERVVEIVEKLELRLRRQSRVIGHIVGRTDEAIEGEDRTTPPLAQEPRGDRKVFVSMALAREGLLHRRHARPVSRIGAWNRPFQ